MIVTAQLMKTAHALKETCKPAEQAFAREPRHVTAMGNGGHVQQMKMTAEYAANVLEAQKPMMKIRIQTAMQPYALETDAEQETAQNIYGGISQKTFQINARH